MRGSNQPTALFDQHAARPAFSQGKWLTFRGVTVGGLGWGMSQPTFGERAFLTIDAEPTSFRGKRQVTQFKSGRLFICYNFLHRALHILHPYCRGDNLPTLTHHLTLSTVHPSFYTRRRPQLMLLNLTLTSRIFFISGLDAEPDSVDVLPRTGVWYM